MAKSKAANARSKGIAYEGLVRKWWAVYFGFTSFDPSAGSGRIGSDLGLVELPWIRGEAKNQKKMTLSSWLKQAKDQAELEGAEVGFVQHKKHGIGNELGVDSGIGLHYVTLTATDFARILHTLATHDITQLSPLPAPIQSPVEDREESPEPAQGEAGPVDDSGDRPSEQSDPVEDTAEFVSGRLF